MRGLIISLVFSCFLSCALQAQTCCTGAAALAGNTVLTNQDAGKFYFSSLVDFNSLNSLIQENQQIANNSVERSTTTFLAQGIYGVSDKFGLSVSIPFVLLQQSAGNSQSLVNNFGLGDILLSPQILLHKNDLTQIQAGVGFKLPTGSTSRTLEGSPIIMTPSLQAGTGSFDFIIHALFNQTFNFRRSFGLQYLASYRMNTTSTRLGGHTQYQFGNELFTQLMAIDQFVISRSILSPAIGFIYRSTAKNKIEGFEDINSGGNWLYVRTGLAYTFNKVNFSIFTELPIWFNLNGLQLTTTYKILGSAGINLN